MPTKFSNTHYYRIAGRYTFSGELYVVRGAIYFFPQADLSDQRHQASEPWSYQSGLAVEALMYLFQKISLFASGTQDLSSKGIPDEQFRENANVRIREWKAQRQRQGFAESLPLPTYIKAEEISGMQLSLTGKLSLSAQSDNHDFNVGPRRRRRLLDVLWTVGLGRVLI
jgi:hypothetical protein